MITRIRVRVRSLQALATKMDPREHDERTTQTVCLLSVVLLLPYLARGQTSSLLMGSVVGLAYTCLVIPMLVSVNYNYPVATLRRALLYIKGMAHSRIEPTKRFLARVYRPLERCEKSYLKMNNIAIMINQLIFFSICERVLSPPIDVPGPRNPHRRMTALYSMLLYNVFAYCISYAEEVAAKNNPFALPYVHITERSDIRHLAMSATKIVLEWTKAVAFLVTVALMLMASGIMEGPSGEFLERYYQRPVGWPYAITSFLYYMATEKSFSQHFPRCLSLFKLEWLDSLENLWAPVLLDTACMALSTVFCAGVLAMGNIRLFLVALYINVYLKYKTLLITNEEGRSNGLLNTLHEERVLLSQYRYATEEELAEKGDDVCAVCLSPMTSKARVTPCHHLFHGECLRLCLRASHKLCPICKREMDKFD